MKIRNLAQSIFTLFLVTIASVNISLAAESLPDPMSPARLVNDFAGIFTSQQQQALEQKLVDFERSSSTQVAVVSVNDLGGYDPSDFAQRLFDKWGIGGKGKNNGVLVLIKPRTDQSKGEVFISVGYGLEGAIPDITAGRIIDNEMIPSLAQGDYYTGTDKAVTVLMQLASGEFTADSYGGGNGLSSDLVAFIIISFIFIFLAVVSSKKGGKNNNSGGRGGGWVPPIIIGGFGGSRGSGGFGGGGFGGGMSGGGGGGRSF